MFRLLGGLLRRQARVPVNAEKAPIGDFPCGIEDKPQEGGTITSGWISLARSKPASSEIIGVSVAPPATSTLAVTASALEVLRHDRAQSFERGLRVPVSRVAAETRRLFDNSAANLADYLRHEGIRQRQRCGRVDRDKAAPLTKRDFPNLKGAANCPAVSLPDRSRRY